MIRRAGTDRALAVLRAALALLAVAACVAAADLARTRDPAPDRAFHAVTGGFGTGPSLHLAGCPAALDERMEDVCPDTFGAAAGCRAGCTAMPRPWAGGE